jgi:VWFA-related protein
MDLDLAWSSFDSTHSRWPARCCQIVETAIERSAGCFLLRVSNACGEGEGKLPERHAVNRPTVSASFLITASASYAYNANQQEVRGARGNTIRREIGGLMPSLRRVLSLTAALGLATAATFSQQPGPSPAPSPAQPGQITIDALVLDKLGYPVRGLDAHDFTLTDNGQPQQLADFHAVAGPSRVIIVLDTINTGFDEVEWEREQVNEFFAEDAGKLKCPVALAVMANGGLKMMKGASSDGQALRASFRQFDTNLRPTGHRGGFDVDAVLLQMSLTQIGQVAAVEGSVPGRKMILVLSPGWPMMPGASEQEDLNQRSWAFYTLLTMVNGMRESNIAIYSLNPYHEGRGNPYYYQAFLKDVTRSDQTQYPFLALPLLAEHSGGRAIVTSKDILGALTSAMREAGPYYQLTFNKPPADRPNEYHALRVTTDKPDLTVRTDSGYYANPQRPAGKLVSPIDSAPPVGSR